MTASRSARYGGSAIDFLEEAVHLLRLAPASTLVVYYLGSVPFVVGFLYFWTDMSRSALAVERHPRSALAVALLFLWMKSCQAIFAGLLQDQLTGLTGPGWSFRRHVRVLCLQAMVQPSGLFLLPVAFAMTLPFGWAFAFYQNVTVLGGTTDPDLTTVCKRASRQAQLWPGQNHALLSVLALFGVFVFLDVGIVLFQTPHLLHSLLGIETHLAQSGWSLLNTTLFMTALGISYLCVDPIVKAVYVLRCFHGQAIESGEDLTVMVRRLAKAPAAVGVVVLIAAALTIGTRAAELSPDQGNGPLSGPVSPTAQAPAARKLLNPGRGSVAVAELTQTIRDVISQREYSWRLPRVKTDTEKNPGLLAAFIDSVVETVQSWMKQGFRLMRDVIRWVLEWLVKRLAPRHQLSEPGAGWITSLHVLLYALLAAVACALALTVLRLWQRRRRRPEPVEAQAIAAAPNLADQDVVADQLPEEGWLNLAQDLVDRGDLRLALRAFYLAGLAHLGHREFIRIAKFKSNREYQRELSRRKPAETALHGSFAELVSTFDWVWYGLGEVDQAVLAQFRGQLQRVTAC